MQRADQAGFVGMMTDRDHVDLKTLGDEDDLGARDRELAQPGIAKTAADHDALGLGPGLGLEETPRDVSELLGEVLDGAMHHRPGLGVVADQDGVQRLLADLVRRLLAERVLAGLAQRLAPALEDLAERALAGTVADEAVLVL